MPTKEEIALELSNLERKVLPAVLKSNSIPELIRETGLIEIEVLRALQWLANKELIALEKKEEEIYKIDSNGKLYLKRGLPEKRFLQEIEPKEKKISEFKQVDKDELNVCVGLLKRNNYINVKKEQELTFSITKEGQEKIKKGFVEEALLNKLPLSSSSLTTEDKKIFEELLKRKNIILKDKKTEFFAKLTVLGKELLKDKKLLETKVADKLTPEMIRTGSWKETQLKTFDITSKVPRINKGKKHFVNEAIEYIRNIWLELGFEEMEGNQVQSAFWDLDALFVPQDHPARELQDTFYLEHNSKVDSKILQKVKKVHETGGDTGSKGWQAPYSEKIAQETLLRTHTTVVSAHTLNKLKKEDLPKKYFIVGKVFRNEVLDWKHLFEFHQVDGIVIDPDVNLVKLKGYLKEFFTKMGFTDVRIRPAHFPYTEPSAEIEAYNPVKKQWVEMGGCGIFRPEVTKTLLGFECPVLAWGLGMERIISNYYKINDLREIYKNDLEQLKTMKTFIK
ncbi:phenylalanine--tRNA ligase subunit alpha [Candidatus Woesearchaeota archaeon CG10_big_fil_rev_8_21_14_0_10_32_9]|nr:MAG: phenylalanine--tRNA ligase subunit alpha [Candidatus Woesearchaeota archaeon CG10_big_fil_rev_8_21_14_0_10_32_9]